MSNISINSLPSNTMKAFIYNLTKEQSKTMFGGFYSGIGILNVTDSTYLFRSFRGDRRYYAIGVHSFAGNENDYNSVKFSRSIYNG